DEYRFNRCAAPCIGAWPPVALGLMPVVRTADLSRDLRVRHDPHMKQYQVSRHGLTTTAPEICDRTGRPVRFDCEILNAGDDRNASAAETGAHGEPFLQVFGRRKRAYQERRSG